MSIPTNEEIYNAIARVLTCRDTRRGRKPSFLVTIITGEDGKTIVTDHNTGCMAAIGKRKYKKSGISRLKKAAKKYKNDKVTVRVPINNDSLPAGARMSPITGKPVRTYTKRLTPGPVAVVDIHGNHSIETNKAITANVVKPVPTYKQELEMQLAEVRDQLSKSKLAREAIAGDPEKAKTVAVYDKVITSTQRLITELSAKLASV